jgi:hypothetical protein
MDAHHERIPAKVPEKGFYYHYKHDPAVFNDHAYEVVGIARHTEDKSFFVLYVPLYENDWFAPAHYQARPLPMFMEEVTKDGKKFPRFSRITDPEVVTKLSAIRSEMYGS